MKTYQEGKNGVWLRKEKESFQLWDNMTCLDQRSDDLLFDNLLNES